MACLNDNRTIFQALLDAIEKNDAAEKKRLEKLLADSKTALDEFTSEFITANSKDAQMLYLEIQLPFC